MSRPRTLHNSQPNSQSISALLDILHARQSFVVSSHARPDGDAIGTSLAFMHLLEAMGKDVVVAFADSIPPSFQVLEGVERIVHTLPDTLPDTAVLLECDSIQRTGFAAIPAAFTINIDHHLSGRQYADFNWIDPEAAAVGVMVYDLAIAAGVTISPAMADCLYTAVLTDTGSFSFPATDASTFRMAAHLVECGTSPNRISQAMYFSNPPSRVRLLGIALSHMHIRGQVCWTCISQADLERASATAEDCEGVVNHLIAIAGIEAAILLREQPNPAEYRLSLRSRGGGLIDVAKVAEHFGGGGHRNASGCTLQGPDSSVVDRVLAQLELQLPTPLETPYPTAGQTSPSTATPQLC